MTGAKHTIRKTSAIVFENGKNRPIIVTVNPRTIEFRAMGLKTSYGLSINRLYVLAVRCDVEDKKRQQVKDKKSRKRNAKNK